MASTLVRSLGTAARSAWAFTGTAMLAVMVALAAGGTAFLMTAGTTSPASSQELTNRENTRVALKSADDSRALFTLLSNALTSASGGLTTSVSAVPQIFDSLDIAKGGAAELVAGLEETSSLSAALDQLNQATATLDGALEQTAGLEQTASGARSALVALRQRLLTHPSPGSAETVAQLDRALGSSHAVGVLNEVTGLRTTLTAMTASLSSASTNASQSLTSARTAARQLRDGLTTLASARKDVNAAVTNLTTGVSQLKIALGAIDGQLGLTQSRLRSVADSPAPARDPGIARPLAWALIAGGVAGTVTYLLALSLAPRLRARAAKTAPADAEAALDESLALSRATLPNLGSSALAGLAVQFYSDAAHEDSGRIGKHVSYDKWSLLLDRSTDTNPWLSVSMYGKVG